MAAGGGRGTAQTHLRTLTRTHKNTPWESPQLFPSTQPTHPSTQPLDPSSSSSSRPGSKHLCLPDLVPLHSGSGPPAADGRFLSGIKSPDGGHSVMIYTALLYTHQRLPPPPPANGLLHRTLSALLLFALPL